MALPIEALRAVRKIVVHQKNATTPCPDGRASAVILRAVLPGVPIVEMAYDSPEHLALPATEGLLFCDFSPPKGRAQEFAAAEAIVLDHHHPDMVKPFEAVGLGVWGDNAKGESGALLAFREVALRALAGRDGSPAQAFRNAMETLALLSAIRDTWKRDSKHWDDACELAAAVCLPRLDDLLKVTPRGVLELAASVGPMLVANQRVAAGAAADTAVRLHIHARPVAFIDNPDAISDAAELLGPTVDLVVAFEYAHESDGSVRLVVHLRSRGAVDCQAIARRMGGGGHKGAAGFPMSVQVTGIHERSPHRMICEALRNCIGFGL